MAKRHEIAHDLGEWAEGYRRKLYRCPAGKLTFGIGWNVEDVGCPKEIADFAHQWFMKEAEKYLIKTYAWYEKLDEVRAAACIDMVYNMGPVRFHGFKKMRKAFERGQYVEAAKQAKDSRWYHQVGRRGPVVVRMIETGEYARLDT